MFVSRTVFDLYPVLLVFAWFVFGYFLVTLIKLCGSYTYSLATGKKHKRVLGRRFKEILRSGRYLFGYIFILLFIITPLGQRQAIRQDLNPAYEISWSTLYEDGEKLGRIRTTWDGVYLYLDAPGHLMVLDELIDEASLTSPNQ